MNPHKQAQIHQQCWWPGDVFTSIQARKHIWEISL